MAKLSKPALARLAFWSVNMLAVRESRWSWPGFSYEPQEWKQMEQLAELVGGGAFLKFILLNAALFIVFAGAAVVGFLLPALLLLYPDTRDLQPLPFTLLLASTVLVTMGLGLPLSMRISAWLSASEAMRKRLSSTPENERLAARVSWQLMRITLIICGILVPGVLLFIAFNIDGGPILAAVNFIAALIMLGAAAAAALRRMPS